MPALTWSPKPATFTLPSAPSLLYAPSHIHLTTKSCPFCFSIPGIYILPVQVSLLSRITSLAAVSLTDSELFPSKMPFKLCTPNTQAYVDLALAVLTWGPPGSLNSVPDGNQSTLC